jgi:hypothetical protein
MIALRLKAIGGQDGTELLEGYLEALASVFGDCEDGDL